MSKYFDPTDIHNIGGYYFGSYQSMGTLLTQMELGIPKTFEVHKLTHSRAHPI